MVYLLFRPVRSPVFQAEHGQIVELFCAVHEPVHRALHGHHGLTSGRFERWLALWTENVDALFEGTNADRAKIKAEAMARSLARSLGVDMS